MELIDDEFVTLESKYILKSTIDRDEFEAYFMDLFNTYKDASMDLKVSTDTGADSITFILTGVPHQLVETAQSSIFNSRVGYSFSKKIDESNNPTKQLDLSFIQREYTGEFES